MPGIAFDSESLHLPRGRHAVAPYAGNPPLSRPKPGRLSAPGPPAATPSTQPRANAGRTESCRDRAARRQRRAERRRIQGRPGEDPGPRRRDESADRAAARRPRRTGATAERVLLMIRPKSGSRDFRSQNAWLDAAWMSRAPRTGGVRGATITRCVGPDPIDRRLIERDRPRGLGRPTPTGSIRQSYLLVPRRASEAALGAPRRQVRKGTWSRVNILRLA